MDIRNKNHDIVLENLYNIFHTYLKEKTCKIYKDREIYLTSRDIVIPDLFIVCDRDKTNKIPDLIIEVISPDTHKNDKGYKKELYEKQGVREYWVVTPGELSIEAYILKEGKYYLDEVYIIYPDYELVKLSKEEKLKIPKKAKSSLFDDLEISIEEVFKNIIKE